MNLSDEETAVVKLALKLAATKSLRPDVRRKFKALERRLEMWALGMED